MFVCCLAPLFEIGGARSPSSRRRKRFRMLGSSVKCSADTDAADTFEFVEFGLSAACGPDSSQCSIRSIFAVYEGAMSTISTDFFGRGRNKRREEWKQHSLWFGTSIVSMWARTDKVILCFFWMCSHIRPIGERLWASWALKSHDCWLMKYALMFIQIEFSGKWLKATRALEEKCCWFSNK